jgi:hypothetical protein
MQPARGSEAESAWRLIKDWTPGARTPEETKDFPSTLNAGPDLGPSYPHVQWAPWVKYDAGYPLSSTAEVKTEMEIHLLPQAPPWSAGSKLWCTKTGTQVSRVAQ